MTVITTVPDCPGCKLGDVCRFSTAVNRFNNHFLNSTPTDAPFKMEIKCSKFERKGD